METNVVFEEMARRSERINPLVAIKLLHTLVWAIMAGSILALPVTALLERFNAANFDRDHSRRVRRARVQ